MLELKGINKTYRPKKGKPVQALKDISVKFDEKGMVFILGKSGCGKSTLLNVIGGLDKFDSGEIIIKGKSSKEFSGSDFDSYRNTFIGFIFQEYNILTEFNIEKNIALALELQGKKATKEAVQTLMDSVDLGTMGKRKTTELSGGQKQRVAIARALIKDPEIIIADEPTGALDSATGKQVFDTLKKLSQDKLVIIVSHDREYAEIYADRIIEMKDGVITSDETKRFVEPQKVTDAIQLVGDSVIRIPKNHKLSSADINQISKLLNSTDEEILISCSDKNNEKFKNVAKISDEGHTEIFNETKNEDYDNIEYDKKKLKFIRSRLKAKDAFKIGSSALKTKPIRLLFTIFLSVVAFSIFGMTQTMSMFSKGSAVYDIISETNMNQITLSKSFKQEFGNDSDVLTKADVTALKTKFPEYNFLPVVGSGTQIHYNENSNYTYSNHPLFTNNISGITSDFSEQQKTAFDTTYVAGRSPVAVASDAMPEIAISKQLFETAKNNQLNFTEISDRQYVANQEDIPINHDNYGSEYVYEEGLGYVTRYWYTTKTVTKVTEYSHLLNRTISIYVGDGATTFKIVGIVDPRIDLSEYEDLTTSELSAKSTELNILTSYSLLNMCYVAPEYYNQHYADGFIDTSIYLTLMNKNSTEEWPSSLSLYDLTTPEIAIAEEIGRNPSLDTDFLTYFKSETGLNGWIKDNKTSLANDEIVLPINDIARVFDILETEVKDKINEGLTLSLSKFNGKIELQELKVVGCYSNNNTGAKFVNQATYKKIISYKSGYSFAMVNLLGNEAKDRALIEYCETVKEDGTSYTVQNKYSGIFSMIDSLITTFTTILVYVAMGFAVFSALMLMNYIATSIANKKREIGVLRAIGARGTDVFKIFYSESFLISIINFILSFGVLVIASILINRAVATGLNVAIKFMRPNLIVFGTMLGISLAVSLIASALPVTMIARKQPIDAINNR